MYKIVYVFSYFVRQFCLPNPFSNLFVDVGMAELFNYLFGGIFIFLSYFLTRSFCYGYERFVGSFGFLLNYILIDYLFLELTRFVKNFNLLFFIFSLCYILLFIIEIKFFGEKYNY